ncbi:MAG: hypothetical protein JRE71_15940 [Deltaproteobacteria bacterium]|nr:hypothetical protein [Deltaproteobacteria bacterium]
MHRLRNVLLVISGMGLVLGCADEAENRALTAEATQAIWKTSGFPRSANYG